MNESITEAYLSDAIASFRAYKKLAEKALAQVEDEEYFITLDEESNSCAVIMKHIAGNMLSRWTDFLTTDGEKPDRHRDMEFVIEPQTTKDDLLAYWEKGWSCLFGALEPLTPEDFDRKVLIRGQEHTIVQAIDRQCSMRILMARRMTRPARNIGSTRSRVSQVNRNLSNSQEQRRQRCFLD